MNDFASKILYLFNRKEKSRALILFSAMLVGAFLEATGIALIFPVIALIGNPEIINEYQALRWLYNFSGSNSVSDFPVWLISLLLGVYIFKYIYLSLFYHFQYRYIFDFQSALSIRLLRAYLHSPYFFHLQHNSARLLTNINTNIPWIINGVIIPCFNSLIELLVVTTILIVLLIISPIPTVGSIVVLGAASAIFYYVVKRKTAALGKIQKENFVEMTKWVNQGLGGVKEVKVLGRESFFLNAYAEGSIRGWRASGYIRTLGDLSRLFIEGIVICGVLLFVAAMLWLDQDIKSLIPTLGLFAVAAIRLMPSANRILYSVTNLRYNAVFVEEIYRDLKDLERASANRPAPAVESEQAKKELLFKKSISLENVSFNYPETESKVLKDVSFTIPKGQSVAFIGASGAGKTTLVDVILGLLEPTDGRVLIDGANVKMNLDSWQRKIGYIPQPIYLSDDTITRNVAFGIEDDKINEEQVWKSLRAAQLEEFVTNLPNKLKTFVGENGVSLSGGQRQRIGIARALYHDPEVLVLDEATAALDNETEKEVTKAIEALSGTKTIIAIAHRLTTVKNFDCLFFMKDGKIVDSADYENLLLRNRDFRKMAGPAVASSEAANF